MSWHLSPAVAKDYVGQRRSGSAVASIEAHLPTCGDCRRLIADLTAAANEPLLDLVWQRVTIALDDATRPWSERALTRLGLSTETTRLLGATSRARLSFLLATLLTVGIAFVAARGGRDAEFGAFLSVAALGPLAATALAFGRRVDPAHALVTTAPTSVWRIVLLRTAASLVPAVAITGLASLIVSERGWVAIAWLLPGIAMAVVSLALSIWVSIEHAALGLATAWIAAPVVALRPAAELIDAAAGLGQFVALGAATLAALVITYNRSNLDFRET
jgi:hypothetical protein